MAQKKFIIDGGFQTNEDSVIAANLDMSGHIIPSVDSDGTTGYDLGAPDKKWRDLYLSQGSLYIDGQKVIQSDSGTIVVKADPNQSLTTKVEGTGVMTLQSDTTVNIAATLQMGVGKRITDAGGNAVQFGDKVDLDSNRIINLGSPVAATDAATKGYIDQSIANVINGSPSALDTLNELANALGDDANFAATVTNSLATKATTAYVDTALAAKADTTYVDSAVAGVTIDTSDKVSKAGDIMTGRLTLTGGSDIGPDIQYSSDYDYGRIRFYADTENNATIHSFGATWQGGNFVDGSAGALNLDAASGVTIGTWNNPDMTIARGGSVNINSHLYMDNGTIHAHSGNSYATLYDASAWTAPIQVLETQTGSTDWRFVPMISQASVSPIGYRQHVVLGSYRAGAWGNFYIGVGGNDGGPTQGFYFGSGGGFSAPGTKNFRIDHPLPEKADTHYLVHAAIEGPQADLIYRGRVTLVNGTATVDLDEAARMTSGTFNVLCKNIQCFTTNESGWDAVRGKVMGSTLVIESQNTASTDEISWMVVGERKDANMLLQPDGRLEVEPSKES